MTKPVAGIQLTMGNWGLRHTEISRENRMLRGLSRVPTHRDRPARENGKTLSRQVFGHIMISHLGRRVYHFGKLYFRHFLAD